MKRIIIALLFVTTSFNCFAQYKIESSVKQEFDSIYKEQRKFVKKLGKNARDSKEFSFITNAVIDTLNKLDYIGLPRDQSKANESMPEEKARLICSAEYFKDTLYIVSRFGFFVGGGIIIKFFNNNCAAQYYEYHEWDGMFKHQEKEEATSDIFVNAEIENLILSEKPALNTGKVYGKITLKTAPFYRHEGEGYFKDGFLYFQQSFTYYFMCDFNEAEETDFVDE